MKTIQITITKKSVDRFKLITMNNKEITMSTHGTRDYIVEIVRQELCNEMEITKDV